MVKTVITVCDYGQIEGGATKIAIESAIALSNIINESIYFHAVGQENINLKSKGVKDISLNQYDILNNPNRISAIIQGIWNVRSKKKFKELLQKKDPKNTIIHVHSWTKAISSSIFKVANELNFKVIVTIHDYFLVCPNGGFFNYKKNMICNYRPLSLKCITCNCDRRNYLHKIWRVIRQIVQNNSILQLKNVNYIYISEFSKNILTRFLRTENLYNINNPIEIKNRKKVDAAANDIYLYVGRLSEEKGIRLFCKAISDLNMNGIVVGDGYLMHELKTMYPNINFVGWQNYEGIHNYILKSRCLVFPSLWYETLGLTIFEAAAFGLPSIVSDCCVGKDFTINELVFSAGDCDSLKNALKLTLDDIFISQLSNHIYENYDCNKLSLDNYIIKLLKVYEEVLSK